jgi:hypothetical protein
VQVDPAEVHPDCLLLTFVAGLTLQVTLVASTTSTVSTMVAAINALAPTPAAALGTT